jgi:hypothetical protein
MFIFLYSPPKNELNGRTQAALSHILSELGGYSEFKKEQL